MKNTLIIIFFLTSFFSAYIFLNFYFFRSIKKYIPSTKLPKMVAISLLSIIALTPILTMVFNTKGINIFIFSLSAAYFGYIWIVFTFLFTFFHFMLFIINRFINSQRLNKHNLPITILISVSILIIGHIESQNVIVKSVTLKSNKQVLQRAEPIKIMQISDVHFSAIIGKELAIKIKDVFEQERPDILLSTGDICDHGLRDEQEIIQIFQSMNPPLGKYAVTGNHEFIRGIKDSIAFLNNLGFKILRDASEQVHNTNINLVGVDDPYIERFQKIVLNKNREIKLLKNSPQSEYTILLKHRPDVISGNTNFFDLQLSGHTHGGQFFPFTIFVRLVYKYLSGLYLLENKANLYVSNGTGSWGPPIRFLAEPEITIFKIDSTYQQNP